MTGERSARANDILVMGVSGSGKSTIGEAIAKLLGLVFVDADTLHSVANVQKMAEGEPLTESDRLPWLASIAEEYRRHQGSGLVVACSALRKSYRDVIRSGSPSVVFIHLVGSKKMIAERMNAREGHFMSAELLQSQIETLEPLEAGEVGVSFQTDSRPDEITAEVMDYLLKV